MALTTQYLETRLKSAGIDDPDRYGISADPDGNITIKARRLDDGATVFYKPDLCKCCGKPYNRKERRSVFCSDKCAAKGPNKKDFNKDRKFLPYQVKRLHPDVLRQNPTLPKYLSPTGQPARPVPGPLALRHGVTGGAVVLVEGALKAFALDARGVESIAFPGISIYRIDDDLRAYLRRRQPDQLFVMYDGDALQLKAKADQVPSSRRPEDFYNSARRFAAQFFDFAKETGLQTRLYFSMVRPDSPHKGVDDVLEVNDRAAVVDDLLLLDQARDYFTSFKLKRSTYDRTLRAFFGLDLYRNFHALHADQLNDAPFRYKGAIYQRTVDGDLLDQTEYFRIPEDPHRVEVPTLRLTIDKYLDEQADTLRRYLREYPRLAISAPTGSGKTTFFRKLHKVTGKKVVIAVPTRILAQQNAGPGVYALYGHVTAAKKAKAANSKTVVATYDTLRHVDDLENRLLVVDEAHNLVAQYGSKEKPFRADTLRHVVEAFDRARGVVLISGTMPRILCKECDFTLVEVTRRQNTRVRVRTIESTGTKAYHLTSCLLDQLDRLDFDGGKIHFVLYNNGAELEAVRDHLTRSGRLTADQIEVVTRSTYDDGEKRIYDQLATQQRVVSDVRLVLSSCLLAEGINIENPNIGRVYAVGTHDADLVRQYAARFRNVDTLDLFCILPKETDLRDAFGISAALQLQQDVEAAQLAARHLDQIRAEMVDDFDADELPYLDQITGAQSYEYRSRFVNVYQDESGAARVDLLRILAAIRERQLSSGNNAYFLTRLLETPNFALYGTHDATPSEYTTDAVKAAHDERTAAQREILDQLRADLTEQPAAVVGALGIHYQETGNRHGVADLVATTADLPADQHATDAAKYHHQHAKTFTDRKARGMVRDYCKMTFAGLDQDAKAAQLKDWTTSKFARYWRTLEMVALFAIYEDRNKRKHLDPVERFDVRALLKVRESIERAAGPGGTLSAADLLDAVQRPFRRIRYDRTLDSPIVEQLATITAAKADALLRELFDVTTTTTCAGGTAYQIVQKWSFENMHFLHGAPSSISRKPLKILALRRGNVGKCQFTEV